MVSHDYNPVYIYTYIYINIHIYINIYIYILIYIYMHMDDMCHMIGIIYLRRNFSLSWCVCTYRLYEKKPI